MTQPKPEYSTLPEVDVRDRTTLPEVINSDPPEAIHTPWKEAVAPPPPYKSATICGMRKKTFWILLVVALVIIIGVAVGVGVGVGVSKKNNSSSSESTTTPYKQGVASYSQLAANNYTDADGVVHSQVYYQDNSKSIWMADFNNATEEWYLSEVVAQNNNSDMTPRMGSPIAAGNYWRNETELSDFRVIWADENDRIRSVFTLYEAYNTSGWSVLNQYDNFLSIDANSSLVHYLPMCNKTTTCNSADFVGFQSSNSSSMRVQWFASGGSSGLLYAQNGDVAPDDGSAMAAAPIPKIEKRDMGYPVVALYLVQDDSLVELYGGSNIDWTNNQLTISGSKVSVDTGAKMAATSQYRLDDFNVQILMTKAAGGVKMAYMYGDAWATDNSIDGMEDVLPLSPIAANQLGRVYAFENGTDGNPQLVEWQRVTGQKPTFERLGVINTTASTA
ncbi:putative fungal fucose-specific lectin protein [Lasiodiplodia theobromae]|uniref:Fungal fucose-specific lectin n=1 Tax=Lasiodiplodia theobromae TaxID=45133 RepID=UPI0015C3A3D8|nr:Fungal fucose-specific lectin [Lasiodiplodia theobromae]KAF4537025.1 Fungal fucose-specific lectin [Lasiodiplodia theobromae]KAF9636021.1 putative fungal fucose-specific lectin protein [Lasiodiplodia theobromae]